MSNIKYNSEQEAFELPYKLWNKTQLIRFYTDSEENITDNLRDVAMLLEQINGGKKKIAELIAAEGLYRGTVDFLKKVIRIDDIYADIDDDGITFCFTVSSEDNCMEPQAIELYEEEFEIVGNAF